MEAFFPRSRSRSQSKDRSHKGSGKNSSRGGSRSQSPSESEHSYDHANDESLEAQYTKLIEYKNSLFKIETLISVTQEEKHIEEYSKLKKNLQQAISYQEEAIKLSQSTDSWIFSTERLLPEYAKRICSGYHPRDKRWYHALVETVDLDKQSAKVAWVGYPETDRLKAMHIKMLDVPDVTKFQQGTICESINPKDGKWQGIVIEKLVEGGYQVKFRKSGNKEVSFI